MLFGFKNANEQINIFNLGCDTTTEVTRIGELIVEEMGLEDVAFKYTGGKRGWKGDVPQFQFDISKINNLGWKATHTSDEVIRMAIKDVLQAKI